MKAFFRCLGQLTEQPQLVTAEGLEQLKQLETDSYLGLTGIGLALAQEFSFWATAVYYDVKGAE